MPETPQQLIARVREYEAKATKGPWRWFGNTTVHDVYLSTVDRGRRYVMDFVRWGMGSAQPRFQVYRGGHENPDDGIMTKASKLVEYEVEYRKDFTRIKNPDADFIAQSRADLPTALAMLEEAIPILATVAEGECTFDGLHDGLRVTCELPWPEGPDGKAPDGGPACEPCRARAFLTPPPRRTDRVS